MLSKGDIKLIRSLSDKAERLESGLFVVEGAKMVDEALRSDFVVDRVFVTGESGEHQRQRNGLPKGLPNSVAKGPTNNLPDVNIENISAKDMERISQMKTPPETLALVRIPEMELCTAALREELVLLLDDIQDPGNMGTIMRVADWFGIRALVCSKGTADCFSPKVVQASMGAVFRVKAHYTDTTAYINSAKKAGLAIYGTFMEGEDIYGARLERNGVIVLGNEGRGISSAIEGMITRRLTIPSFPAGRKGSESLNVATAAAIVCSEFRRRSN